MEEVQISKLDNLKEKEHRINHCTDEYCCLPNSCKYFQCYKRGQYGNLYLYRL